MNLKDRKKGAIGSAVAICAMLAVVILSVIPGANPARISDLMAKTSLFSAAFHFDTFKGNTINSAANNDILDSAFLGLLHVGILAVLIAAVIVLASAVVTLISGKAGKYANKGIVLGGFLGLAATLPIYDAYATIGEMTDTQITYFRTYLSDKEVYNFFKPVLPVTLIVLSALFAVAVIGGFVACTNLSAINSLRFMTAFTIVGAFFAALNPARITSRINQNNMFVTMAIKKSSFLDAFTANKYKKGYATKGPLNEAHIFSIVLMLAIVVMVVAFCMYFGELRVRRVGNIVAAGGSLVGIAGLVGILTARADLISQSSKVEELLPMLPLGIFFYFLLFIGIFVFATYYMIAIEKPVAGDAFEIKSDKKLFLYMLPFIALVIVFCYLPLWFWRIAFYNYQLGIPLTSKDFVGMQFFEFLFQKGAYRKRIFSVMKNTLCMSGLGLAGSVLPVIFAIFISEIKRHNVKSAIQTLTTLPNFISWVLVYTVATAMFDSKGLWNVILSNFDSNHAAVNYLNSNHLIYLKMWLWGVWKGLGWSSIVYVAAISGIDQQLYEAATVDGAGRFRKMWHITVPGLIPTFFVLFMLSIAGILSNGMDQYYVFDNTFNHYQVEVLDLYVYNLGLGDKQFELATVVGMLKTVVSLVLLFTANGLSKLIRGESVM